MPPKQCHPAAELAREFVVTAIIRPLIVVRRKADDVVGTLTVQEKPRLYFGFEPWQVEGE